MGRHSKQRKQHGSEENKWILWSVLSTRTPDGWSQNVYCPPTLWESRGPVQGTSQKLIVCGINEISAAFKK